MPLNLDAFLSLLRNSIPPILTFELLLGGQARITHRLTPRLYAKAMRKAPGTRDAFYPFIPIYDPTRHSNFIGLLMCMAGVCVAKRETRGSWGPGLTVVLTSMGIYSQRRMGIPYWLPVVNTVLAGVMWVLERQQEGRVM